MHTGDSKEQSISGFFEQICYGFEKNRVTLKQYKCRYESLGDSPPLCSMSTTME